MSERGTKERQKAYHHIRKTHVDTLALLDNYEIYGRAKVIEKIDNLMDRLIRARTWMQQSGQPRPKRQDRGHCGNGPMCPMCNQRGKR